MSYKYKYLKYKKKYLTLKNLKGGNEEIKLFKFDSDTIFYHGTYNKINNELLVPSFYSHDPLQSLGHILNIPSLCATRPSDRLPLSRIQQIAESCYPLIYKFKNTQELNLIRLIPNSMNYDSIVGRLLQKEKLKEYLLKKENRVGIYNKFVDKYAGVKRKRGAAANETEESLLRSFDKVIDDFEYMCKDGCFTGWANSPLYYFLSQIDYNLYFREVFPELELATEIDGLYIENDQNETVLFNNKKMQQLDIFFVLPYYFYNNTNNDLNKLCDARKFIAEYNKICNEFIIQKSEEIAKYYEMTYLLGNVIRKLASFNYIDIEKTKMWNFSWYISFCDTFNPYEPININEDNCPTLFSKNLQNLETCTKVYESSSDFNNIPCKSPIISHKISISNVTENSKDLQNWINNISFFSESKLNILDKLCSSKNIITDRIM